MKTNRYLKSMGALGGLALMVMVITGCPSQKSMLGTHEAALKTYVAPGEYDEFYAFLSGGYSGQLSVFGLPSGRLIKVIPVFSQDPESGYGYYEESKALLNTSYGFIPWDDSHHPHLSQTDGVADGRWIFINGNNTPRIARIDLTTFETVEIIEIPNTGGNHGSSFVTENTEYVVGATRFSQPMDAQKDVPISSYKENFDGALSMIKIDQKTGKMELEFQIKVPPYNYDLVRAGKGKSKDWYFFTTYNTEQAHTLLEINASKNDKDFVAALNWKKAAEAVKAGKAKKMKTAYKHNYYDPAKSLIVTDDKNEVWVLDPKDAEGILYFMPTPKSPHGVDVDPTGEYLVAGGKLATVIPVHSFSKMLKAIENKEIETHINGIPVLKYESTIVGEVENPGLGPLHTEFDGNGFAYTSVYISSEIVKWSLSDFKVVDRIDAYYSIGHLMIPGGDTKKPYGKYMLGLTKTPKDRYLPVGPKQNHPAQLYDISGEKMKLLLDFPTIGEPHYAQAIGADKIMSNSKKIYELENNKHPHALKSVNDARVVREGNVVRVYMASIRSHFRPDNIEGIKVGDTVYFHITNLEQEWDVVHGFAIKGAEGGEVLLAPGQTKTFKWEPKKTGIYPFYCTAFCSALHQEMQGYVRVSAAGSNVPLKFKTGV